MSHFWGASTQLFDSPRRCAAHFAGWRPPRMRRAPARRRPARRPPRQARRSPAAPRRRQRMARTAGSGRRSRPAALGLVVGAAAASRVLARQPGAPETPDFVPLLRRMRAAIFAIYWRRKCKSFGREAENANDGLGPSC